MAHTLRIYYKDLKTEFMPDFEHFRFSYSRMNPTLGASAHAVPQVHTPGTALSDTEPGDTSPDQIFCFGDAGQDGLDSGFLSNSFRYLYPSGSMHRASFAPLPPHPPPPPAAAALRNDLGSNISVLKTLNLRFRCFLAKVHELERRNKALETQLQQTLEDNNNERGCGQDKRNGYAGSDFIASANANDSACLTRTLLGPNGAGVMPRNKLGDLDSVGVMDSNSNLSPPFSLNSVSPVDPKSTSSIRQNYDGIGTERFSGSMHQGPPTSIWFHNPPARFNNSWELRVSGPRVSWPYQDGVGVQIDTVTPEIRALNNVLAKVKLERDEYKQRSAFLHQNHFITHGLKMLRVNHVEIQL